MKKYILITFLTISSLVFSQVTENIAIPYTLSPDLMVMVKGVHFGGNKSKPLDAWEDDGSGINKVQIPVKSYIALIKEYEAKGYELIKITEGTEGLMNVNVVDTKFWFRKKKNI